MDTAALDSDLALLAEHREEWARLPISEKVVFLDEMRRLTLDNAEAWANAAIEGKGLSPDSPISGEEWISGPYPVLGWLEAVKDTLNAIGNGTDPLAGVKTWERHDGQVAVRVYPTNLIEKLLLDGYSAEVWMEPDVSLDSLGDSIGVFYREEDPQGNLALILGAGNISSIVPLDALYKLYGEGAVVMVKLHTVNDYLGPIFERIFAPLIDAGYLRFVYGGPDVGAYLTGHEAVDTIHLTGNRKTHDAIVFGAGDDGAGRRARNEPITDKPVTSELGGVGATIIIPGPWDDADFVYQAEHVATQKLHNGGFNCISAQVAMVPAEWEGKATMIDAMRRALTEAEERPAYYPGAGDRQQAARDAYPDCEKLEVGVDRTLIVGVDPQDESDYAFTEEFFAPVLSTTEISGSTAAEFLRESVRFANQTLQGTLAINIIVDPATAKELGTELERAIEDLKFGTVAVNAWTGVGFLLARAPWGAFPGHSYDDIQSGIGVVHNALLFDRPQKTVVRAPFRPFPRSLRHGETHISPRPPWFVSNKTADVTAKRLTYYAGDKKLRRLPGVFASALRG
ncbi:MAG: aldehyde dehydrogenase family protein [Acidimicrobiia bacterium]|nr:MAG: aldehyde dehydrogenase family protein [Acidimicrobiia bacterium]